MAAPARVNQANGNNYTGSTALTQATSAFAATAGNHIAVISRGGAVTSVVDTAGNTYVKAGGDADGVQELWYAENILGNASNVVTVNFAAATAYRDVTAIQHSGLRTSGSLGAFAQGTVASGATVSCTPSGITHLAEQICVVAADIYASGSFTFTPSGFTALFTNTSTTFAARNDTTRVFDGTVPIIATGPASSGKGIVAGVFLGIDATPPARTTQFAIETLSRPAPSGRVTQAIVEVLGGAASLAVPGQVTQIAVETLQPVITDAWVSQLTVETLYPVPPIPVRATHLFAEVYIPVVAGLRATQLAVEVFHPRLVPVQATQAVVEYFEGRSAATHATQVAVEVFVVPVPCVDGSFPIDSDLL